MWLEQLARKSPDVDAYGFPFVDSELDFRLLLRSVVVDRARARDPNQIARALQAGIAHGVARCLQSVCKANNLDTVVVSGGVFQNELLLEDLKALLAPLQVWTNHSVPANDGGISLGQAALAAFHR